MIRTALLAVLMLLLCAAVTGAQEAVPMVTLRPEATVTTGEVALGQVADLQAPTELASRLAAVSLSSAPPPGGARRIEVGYVRLRLRRFGFDPSALELHGEVVTVRRPGSPVAAPSVGAESAAASTSAPPAAPLVRRGQILEVEVSCGAVAIRAAATAAGEGGLGDLISVQLDRTNRRLIGRITGPGRVALVLQEGGS